MTEQLLDEDKEKMKEVFNEIKREHSWIKQSKSKFIELTDEKEVLQDKLHRIKTWVNAYPIDIFPEPDFAKAHNILLRHGISLDAISASNMRHVLTGINDIIEGEKGDKNER